VTKLTMRLCNVEVPPEVRDDTLRAFLRLYQLETWAREMVYLELRAYYGADWWAEVEAALKRARFPVKLTDKYLAKDKRHAHLSTPENDPLWFISFDSLLKIIFDRKLWKHFKSYFTTKRLLRARVEELVPIRNRVAHCRPLHAYDVDRLEQFMRDFDQGFWKFCTSYSDRYGFAYKLSENGAFTRFKQAENLDLSYSVRPFVAKRKTKPELGPGLIYDVTITTRHLGRYFDYETILRQTRSLHKYVLHIMLDSFQHSLRITFPSTLAPETVIDAIERFARAAHNFYNIAPLVPLAPDPNANVGERDVLKEHDERNRPFQQIASNWPHYVIPPSHPFTFLDRGCPCSFFGV
jgi:hypothetical protein